MRTNPKHGNKGIPQYIIHNNVIWIYQLQFKNYNKYPEFENCLKACRQEIIQNSDPTFPVLDKQNFDHSNSFNL